MYECVYEFDDQKDISLSLSSFPRLSEIGIVAQTDDLMGARRAASAKSSSNRRRARRRRRRSDTYFWRIRARGGVAEMTTTTKTSTPPKVVLGTMTFSGQTDKSAACAMVEKFSQADTSLVGRYPELDTARMYCGGGTETLLGEMLTDGSIAPEIVSTLRIATKANPTQSLTKEGTIKQLTDSLISMQTESCDLFYLHAPDANAYIEDTLAAVQNLYEAGKFKRLGISNYAAWEVVWIHSYMKERGWIIPTVYQGMMNAITRASNEQLLPALRRLNMSFNLYNPLAGGVLTGKYKSRDDVKSGRFTGLGDEKYGKMYQDRFMLAEHFEAMEIVLAACETESIPPAEAALRWCKWHSGLSSEFGDGIIIGVSTMAHFESNMASLDKGPLPSSILEAYDKAWALCKPVVAAYSRGISGSNLPPKKS